MPPCGCHPENSKPLPLPPLPPGMTRNEEACWPSAEAGAGLDWMVGMGTVSCWVALEPCARFRLAFFFLVGGVVLLLCCVVRGVV